MMMHLAAVRSGVLLLASFLSWQTPAPPGGHAYRFAIAFAAERSKAPLDGRMILMISKNGSKEPRFQVNDGLKSQQVFGIDVDGLKAGRNIVFDGSVRGFPLSSLNDIPPGDYWVQG
ncbi:MAG: hypothetical protein O7B26_03540, partial [Planctomycetota bacterium]|nr:hypothetical protein [Planctomycetota bacterium]